MKKWCIPSTYSSFFSLVPVLKLCECLVSFLSLVLHDLCLSNLYFGCDLLGYSCLTLLLLFACRVSLWACQCPLGSQDIL